MEEVRGASAGPFEDLEGSAKTRRRVVSRFTTLLGIPRRSYTRWRACARAAAVAPLPGKGPWPAPAVEAVEPTVAKYAQDWPAWGHRKIWGLMRADGYEVSVSTVERAMRRRNLLQPVEYQRERRELAAARKAAFSESPTAPNQVWQLDVSEYETRRGGIWRIAGCADYHSKYEFGWHLATTCNAGDAEQAVRIAIAEAERLAGGVALAEQLTDPRPGPESGERDRRARNGLGGQLFAGRSAYSMPQVRYRPRASGSPDSRCPIESLSAARSRTCSGSCRPVKTRGHSLAQDGRPTVEPATHPAFDLTASTSRCRSGRASPPVSTPATPYLRPTYSPRLVVPTTRDAHDTS